MLRVEKNLIDMGIFQDRTKVGVKLVSKLTPLNPDLIPQKRQVISQLLRMRDNPYHPKRSNCPV